MDKARDAAVRRDDVYRKPRAGALRTMGKGYSCPIPRRCSIHSIFLLGVRYAPDQENPRRPGRRSPRRRAVTATAVNCGERRLGIRGLAAPITDARNGGRRGRGRAGPRHSISEREAQGHRTGVVATAARSPWRWTMWSSPSPTGLEADKERTSQVSTSVDLLLAGGRSSRMGASSSFRRRQGLAILRFYRRGNGRRGRSYGPRLGQDRAAGIHRHARRPSRSGPHLQGILFELHAGGRGRRLYLCRRYAEQQAPFDRRGIDLREKRYSGKSKAIVDFALDVGATNSRNFRGCSRKAPSA